MGDIFILHNGPTLCEWRFAYWACLEKDTERFYQQNAPAPAPSCLFSHALYENETLFTCVLSEIMKKPFNF